MHISSIRIENFRNLGEVSLRTHPKLNYFQGANGAGKTSLLEAVVVLARGKSFRTVSAEELYGAETGVFRIFLEAEYAKRSRKMGLERQGKQWRARLDGSDVPFLSVLSRHLPLVLMEPNSHLLISGSPDVRRRFLDAGVFHVEPGFLEIWRRYSRVLKQRNAALRSRQIRVLDSLDEVFAELGEALHELRSAYFKKLDKEFDRENPLRQTASLESVELGYDPGWKNGPLIDVLKTARKRDLERGVSSHGPHRADLLITREKRLVRTYLSRGEQKGLAALLLLTQAHMLAALGEKPLVLLDDLASEFDQTHFNSVLQAALAVAGQVWITGTTKPDLQEAHKMFHVEHGAVQEMV